METLLRPQLHALLTRMTKICRSELCSRSSLMMMMMMVMIPATSTATKATTSPNPPWNHLPLPNESRFTDSAALMVVVEDVGQFGVHCQARSVAVWSQQCTSTFAAIAIAPVQLALSWHHVMTYCTYKCHNTQQQQQQQQHTGNPVQPHD